MPIDLKTVLHTAELARLDLSYGLDESEAGPALEKMAGDLTTIVGYIDVLSEADTEGVEPLYSPMLEAPGPRADVPAPERSTEGLLNQAPDRIGSFFAVPKII